MGKRYFIELSRKDVGLVSYFPGIEVKDDPKAGWIEKVLLPAIGPIANRKTARIREIPITFWIDVRKTARRGAEIFLFMTPAYPGAIIERALNRALEPIRGGKVHAGREPIPKEAIPCLQIFRGRLIRFYSAVDGYEGFHLATVWWKDDFPRLVLLSIPENYELIKVDAPIEEVERLLAEARILSVSNGEECRKFQQALIPIARQVD
jgi:hypothetical protein